MGTPLIMVIITVTIISPDFNPNNNHINSHYNNYHLPVTTLMYSRLDMVTNKKVTYKELNSNMIQKVQ